MRCDICLKDISVVGRLYTTGNGVYCNEHLAEDFQQVRVINQYELVTQEEADKMKG